MIRRLVAAAAVLPALVIGISCSSSGEGGREVAITQRDDGCSPKSVGATTGEKLNLVVTNESSKEPYEVEGEGGTPLEEIAVPKGKSREVGLSVPDEAKTYEIKCYVPGDVQTIIEIDAKAATRPTSTGY